ncbi:MAG: nicotinate (nicotinamide) nucleotide adenylyltransferase [Ruminococcaceae bacterium]|nr:nicotinate (nicotinamide) nucleotide adenylyltransferase [Oscillospiraceae bacterium]
MQKPIAVLGGTFNPIHNGHIKMAYASLLECDVSKVIFLPNGMPPHKDGEGILSSDHRFNMVKLAIEGEQRFELSDYEIKRDKPSYTVDTQRALKEIYNCPIYFIIGADSLYTLHLWKNPDVLIRECNFIVCDRKTGLGSDVKDAADKINDMGGSVKVLSMPRIDITSTELRNYIKTGKDVSDYLSANVYEYIKKNKLYL